MSDWSFNVKLAQLERKYGDKTSCNVPSSVLHFFLKENNGDMDKCIQDLERNNWIGSKQQLQRHMSEVSPTDAVNDYQRTSSQFLSSSNDSAMKFHQQLHNRTPHQSHVPESTGLTNDRDYYGDVFAPHPPLLPKSTSPGIPGGDRNQTNWHIPSQSSSNHSPPSQYGISSSLSAPGPSRPRHPGYTKQLSEADKEMILRRQRECNEQAKKDKERVEARLQEIKQDVSFKNDKLMTLRRENSIAKIPNEDEMEFMKIIIDTLEIDIKDEEEKRKTRNWSCKNCNWINNYIMTKCDYCNELRPRPSRLSTGSSTGGGHSPTPLPRTGYNYR